MGEKPVKQQAKVEGLPQPAVSPPPPIPLSPRDGTGRNPGRSGKTWVLSPWREEALDKTKWAVL